jgi:23S rRNA (cytosine1962-C5)-methyltransferase
MDDVSALAEVRLKRGHERRVRRGHPWVFSNELEYEASDHVPGDPVRVLDSKGRLVGIGYINPHSLIAVRLLRRDEGPIDVEFLSSRLRSAIDLRKRLYPREEVVRLVYSESDGLPGLIVDRYGDHLVVQITTAGMDRLQPIVLDLLDAELEPKCIVARNDVHFRDLEGLPREVNTLRGEINPDLTVRYEGLDLAVELTEGQKTGLYLDQRDNQRTLLPALARGSVLDAYCYQGVWGLLSLRAGAENLLGVDSSRNALDLARRHAERNGLSDRAEWERADVLETLKRLRSEGRTFDLVVLDPPAFAKSRKHVKEGLRGYLDLNRKGFDLVRPGGVLISCSCSHHVRPEVFRDTLAHAASLAGRHARVLTSLGQSQDHAPLLTAPETDYLKCVTLQVER